MGRMAKVRQQQLAGLKPEKFVLLEEIGEMWNRAAAKIETLKREIESLQSKALIHMKEHKIPAYQVDGKGTLELKTGEDKVNFRRAKKSDDDKAEKGKERRKGKRKRKGAAGGKS